MSRALLPLLVALVSLPFMGGASCIPKDCLDDSFCVRECECSGGGVVIQCPVTFKCDLETDTCEEAHRTMTCDEICEDFAAQGNCGNRRCTNSLDCKKTVTCQFATDPTNPEAVQITNCEFPFECNGQSNSCETDYVLSDDELCGICYDDNFAPQGT